MHASLCSAPCMHACLPGSGVGGGFVSVFLVEAYQYLGTPLPFGSTPTFLLVHYLEIVWMCFAVVKRQHEFCLA